MTSKTDAKPKVPKHLRQSVTWTKKSGEKQPHPNVKVRNMKMAKGKPETDIKKQPKTKTGYAYMFHDCTRCKKKELLKIPVQAVALMVEQIKKGYEPQVPDGMQIRKIRIFGGEKK